VIQWCWWRIGSRRDPRRKFAPPGLAVYTKHASQLTNPKGVVVVMFCVELSAVDETHRHLKPFMEGGGLLKFRRCLRKRLNKASPPTAEFFESLRHRTVLMPLRQLLKT
jgi:hypothetical protein